MGLAAAQVAPVPRLQKCYLPISRSGHMRILGVTLRHLERRALSLGAERARADVRPA
jgi:hypothetical protein